MASKRRRRKTPDRQPWTAVIAAVVAVLSLAFNGCQYLDKRDLDRRIDEATAAKIESEVAVELEVRYLVVPGTKVGQWPAGLETDRQPPLLLKNSVLASLQAFAMRAEVGGPVLEEKDGVMKAHAGIVLRIRNRGATTARSLKLTAHRKDFAAKGQSAEQPWLIETKTWPEETIPLADLEPGRDWYVPLIHLVGSQRYLGTAYLPVRVAWQNAATHKAETMEVQRMAPEDQWVAEGLDVTYGQ